MENMLPTLPYFIHKIECSCWYMHVTWMFLSVSRIQWLSSFANYYTTMISIRRFKSIYDNWDISLNYLNKVLDVKMEVKIPLSLLCQ